MHAKDAIRLTLDNSDFILKAYLNDLSDDEMLARPVEGMNHIAWQFGHLISAERMFAEAVKPGASPALPQGFEERHDPKSPSKDDRAGFATKTEYLRLWDAQRAATKSALDSVS